MLPRILHKLVYRKPDVNGRLNADGDSRVDMLLNSDRRTRVRRSQVRN